MSKTETDRNLVLCGFMGCGKSTVGRLYRQAADFTVTVPIEQPASEIAAEILHKIRGQLKTDLRGLAKSEKKG